MGAAHCLALATLPNIKYPSDVFPSSHFFTQDLAELEIELSGPSRITTFPGLGIGCTPEPSQLAARAPDRGVNLAPIHHRQVKLVLPLGRLAQKVFDADGAGPVFKESYDRAGVKNEPLHRHLLG